MALQPKSKLRDVRGITEAEKESIRTFMQGAVYCWVKNRSGEPFAVRDLMGGENFEWAGTPLYVLYQKHINARKDNESAIKSAAKDLGWLLKNVLARDKRTFTSRNAGLVATYRWIGNEP